jgi:hypothetical protein
MRSARYILYSTLLISTLFLTRCSKNSPAEVHTYSMGDRVELGHLIYTVFETRWLPQVGEGPTARIPENRFFLVRMSVGNTGGTEALVPNMTIEDDKGNSYPELTNGEGIPQFLGVLQAVRTAEPAAGNALFDAPPGHYKLRLSDENSQRAAMVDIPLTFHSESPEVPTPSAEAK